MPDQVDWRSMEREASTGHAVGRLLRDQREARALSIEEEAGDHSGARRLIHFHRDVLNCGLNGETL